MENKREPLFHIVKRDTLSAKEAFVIRAVAIVAAENEKAADKALGRIKVTYNVLEPLLDFRNNADIHPQ